MAVTHLHNGYVTCPECLEYILARRVVLEVKKKEWDSWMEGSIKLGPNHRYFAAFDPYYKK